MTQRGQFKLFVFFCSFGLTALAGYALNVIDPRVEPHSTLAIYVPFLCFLLAVLSFMGLVRMFAKHLDISVPHILILVALSAIPGAVIGLLAGHFVAGAV